MSFGFSVGDFIAVLQLVKKIRKGFVDAPTQFESISDELRSLSIVLQDFEIVLSETDLTTQQKTELQGVADGCLNVLQELEQTLGKYHELNPGSASIKNNVKKAWKRLKWEPEDIKDLRSRIVANVTLLNTIQGGITSQRSLEIKDGVDRLREQHNNREDRDEFQTILEWLTPIDYAPQQNDTIARRQEGTGQWLLDSIKFQAWLETNNDRQTLFSQGMPGAGKTILTSVVVKELTTRFSNDPTIGIAYIYCNFKRRDEQKIDNLLASLLKQLAECQPCLPACIRDLYNQHKTSRTRPTPDEITRALQSVSALYSRVFIIIDALDECQVSDSCRTRLLSEIFSLQAKSRVQLFATSRVIPEITEMFDESMQLEIRASSHDIQSYLDGHISQLPGCVRRSSELQEEVKAEIIRAVDGMFLLAQLHLDSLSGKKSPKAIRDALKTLPTGSEAYDEAYKKAMERIEGQFAGETELAKRVISWITCARRPLTTLELEHALAIETGESQLDEENLCQVEDMISVCAGLVIVDEESGIVRLVHHTTQEYFTRTQSYWFPDIETDITITCITYLSFDVFGSGFCKPHKLPERIQLNKFYEYAARNWGHHACNVTNLNQELSQVAIGFLMSEAKVNASSQVLLSKGTYLVYHLRFGWARGMTGLHLAAYFGVKAITKLLLDTGKVDIDSKDKLGYTPLSWASRKGHETVVKLLLDTGKVDIDSKDKLGYTPLSWASRKGREAVVKLLLNTGKVDIDSKDKFGYTPLSWASRKGREAVVKLLLDTGKVDTDLRGNDGYTPLSLALKRGNKAVIKLLLDIDKDNTD